METNSINSIINWLPEAQEKNTNSGIYTEQHFPKLLKCFREWLPWRPRLKTNQIVLFINI